ncbi:hypothetical protein C8R41DRAFT_915649 [Lentinula lateritia]|uniref:Uncharacterized protein n=1 Tax=Lentinula lateritia TaxID=40482 RepID=A0ABQ8VUV2_9AGAR|nr:hypothetical protein C8R41DRAFT_915649 [Lentinula lateritia]
MASTSSQTQAAASTTLLPTSLMEAQVILAGLSFKSTLPLFFESAVFVRLQQGDYSPPTLDSQNSPDFDGATTFPAFSYPRPLVPFCFPSNTSRPLSVASGLDLYCSAQMAVRTLQSGDEDSIETDLMELYHLFEDAAPYLLYIHEFWMGRANCPLFAEQILLAAEFLSARLPAFLRDSLLQQWGIPPEHRSSSSDAPVLEHFPTIPIPFCLRFREGSALMRTVPSEDLDVFASLHGKGSPGTSKAVLPPKVSDIVSSPPATKAQTVPPRALRRNREIESLKADASSFFDTTPRASSSAKVPVGKKEPKSKTTVKVVEDSKSSKPTPSAMAYKRVRLPPRSRKIAPVTAKGKSRRVVVSDDDSASNEVESEDEEGDEEEDEAEEEDSAPPSKRLKTTSSISASLPRRSVKRVTVPKRVSKVAAKPVPERSPESTFQPVLLADAQGRLRLPEQSSGSFTPFTKFAHARNSAALS